MPTVYLRQDLYERILAEGDDPVQFVNLVVERELWKRKEEKSKSIVKNLTQANVKTKTKQKKTAKKEEE